MISDEGIDEKLNLSFLLNLFDGVLETPGRILIITSNYPEKIDKALLRPGRIDLNIVFGYCTKNTIIQIIKSIYELTYNLDNFDFPDNEYTPAEVTQILFNNIDDKENGLKLLLKENIEYTRRLYNIQTHSQLKIDTSSSDQISEKDKDILNEGEQDMKCKKNSSNKVSKISLNESFNKKSTNDSGENILSNDEKVHTNLNTISEVYKKYDWTISDKKIENGDLIAKPYDDSEGNYTLF